MTGIQLTRTETAAADELRTIVGRLRAHIAGDRMPHDEVLGLHGEMARLGHELHASLAARSLEPRHRGYMVENRGMEPSHPDFYGHMHPVEDLFKFIQDVRANDDPPDVTMGAEFTFRAYSRRWGHDDHYKLVRTVDGWDVSFISIGGACDREGKPFLFRNLQHDGISYPEPLGWHMSDIWREAENGADGTEVQRRLDELSDWVRVTESATPGEATAQPEPQPKGRDLYSVFICFGQPDADFARELERNLTNRGVVTRFFEKDARPGEALHRFMWRGVADQDRVVVVCSEEGLARSGVRNEVEQSFAKEARAGGVNLLIPVALDRWLYNGAGDQELRQRLTARAVCDCFDRDPDAAADAIMPALRIRRAT